MEIFRFEHPEYLYGLILLPLLFIALLLLQKAEKKRWILLGELQFVNRLMPKLSYKQKNRKRILLLMALAMMILALANPQVGSKLQKVKRQGNDLIIALDISNSMMAEDLSPNRLSASKMAISRLIDQLSGDRLGMVVFAGNAYTQLPITSDYAAAKMFLSSVNTEYISTQGTSISSAVEQAKNTFEADKENGNTASRNQILVIITDGEDHEEQVIESVSEARQKGILVYTIGMGTYNGAPVPEYRNGIKTGYKTDAEGHTVVSRYNEGLLEQIAKAGGGKYYSAANNPGALRDILKELNQLEKSEFETQVFRDYESRFQIFAIVAILLLAIEALWSERKIKFSLYKLMNSNPKL
jgi:Ca-activated chloride channel family protein